MSSCFYTLNPSAPQDLIQVCYNDSAPFIVSHSEKEISTTLISAIAGFANSADASAVWVLITAALVFSLQIGFIFIQSSFIPPNQIQSVLFKNLIATCICAIVFYIVGYSMAYGSPNEDYREQNRFMGVGNILIEDDTFQSWFFEFMYLAASSTIAAGSISYRSTTASYFCFTIFFSAWIYPVIVYWCWSQDGWLSPFSFKPRPYGGLIDFAGSGVVHMVAGFSAFIACRFLGNRPNRFNEEKRTKKEHTACVFGHNIVHQVYGILFIWFGYYGFNCGRTLGASNVMQIASKVAVTTTLSAATSGLTTLSLTRFIEGYWSIPRICDGILVGLVSISSPCNVIDCGYAILIGFLAAICYYCGIKLLERLRIDDPMNSFIIHGLCGGVGLWAAGLFATTKDIEFGYSNSVPELSDESKGHRLAAQITGSLVISIWTMLNCILIFGLMHYCGFFRENPTELNNETSNGKIQMTSRDDESEEKKDDDGQK